MIALVSTAEALAAVLNILLAYRLILPEEEQSLREELRIAYAMIMQLKKSVF